MPTLKSFDDCEGHSHDLMRCARCPKALMIEFFLPNSRALLPTYRANCPNGSHIAQKGSHFSQNTTTNTFSLLSSHTPLSGICTNTKHPQPQWGWGCFQNTSFPGLILKLGKTNYCLGKMDPTWAKCLKIGQNFSRRGNFFIYS